MPKNKRGAPPGRKFVGKLNSPIEYLPSTPIKNILAPDFNEAAESQRIDRHYRTELDRRIELLFVEYDIDKNEIEKWRTLALFLAYDFVPGFQVAGPAKKVGNKQRWDIPTQWKLVRDVKARMKKQQSDGARSSALRACKQMVSDARRGNTGSHYARLSGDSLARKYRDATRHLAPYSAEQIWLFILNGDALPAVAKDK
ncbi:MAG: hypothetical protein U1F35_05515 [Steroidobacteraceae bacterium]